MIFNYKTNFLLLLIFLPFIFLGCKDDEADEVQPVVYTLATSVVGQGSISPSEGTYEKGEIVSLTATAATGWEFNSWSGDVEENNNPLILTMDKDKTVVAHFIEVTGENDDNDGEGSDGDENDEGSSAIVNPGTVEYSLIGYATVSGEGYETTTGGKGGTEITISDLAELESWAASREKNTTPEIVYIKGKISSPTTTVVTIKHGENISILGLGGTAELDNVGLNIRNYKNVIVRNLKIHEVFYPNDGLTIDESQHVWVDHCEFYSKIGAGIGVDTYDGLLDIKKGSRYITVSWNHFHDHMKTMLIGHTDNVNQEPIDSEMRITLHHNFFENTDGRNPSLRWGAVHMFNNYLKDIADYGIAVRQGAHALLENNVYENVKLPITTDKFTGEGYVCENNNSFIGTSGASSITQTDCEWWDALPYTYELDPVESIATLVPANVGVGRIDVRASE